MPLTEQNLLEAFSSVKDIHTNKDLVALRAIQNLRINGGQVSLTVQMPYPAQSLHEGIATQLRAIALRLGAEQVEIDFALRVQAHAVQRGVALLAQVRNIVAVASGKGGVGKSTTTANLALALAQEGASVGVLDADIYGPSQPMMLGIDGQRPHSDDGKTMQPLESHGVQAMSIGFLVKADDAMIWRGPMAVSALEQMLRQTQWRDLDYLLIDMPPGTGDIQLTLSQRVPLTGAVIVSTPQDIALLDARKGIRMFEKVNVPILGLVENMAVHVCSQCGHAEHIFGVDGGKKLAAELGMECLGSLPLDIRIREQADGGQPTVVAQPDSAVAQSYRQIARQIAAKIALQSKDYSSKFPTITISKNS